LTGVTNATGVSIVTGCVVKLINTTKFRVTGVISADVVVITLDDLAHTFSCNALVIYRAEAVVIAGKPIIDRHVLTNSILAGVHRALITVITVHGLAHAYTVHALIIQGAGISIITSQGVIHQKLVSCDSSNANFTRIFRVKVAILETFTLDQTPPRGQFVCAIVLGNATIYSAIKAVITSCDKSPFADQIFVTFVVNRTWIMVITCLANHTHRLFVEVRQVR
jgi:hypothetical protein